MCKFITILFIIFLSCFLALSAAKEPEDTGVFGKLKSGLKLAGKLLGLDAASEVAKLVTESFAKPKPSRKGDNTQSSSGIFTGFFRLLGLESTKIGAIAVNALVFLAQLISSSLSKPAPPELIHARKLPSGTPLDWITQNTALADIIEAAKDPELPENLITNLKDQTSDDETGCIQLLLCKSSPLLWGMQKAINGSAPKEKATGASVMFQYLPNLQELADHGDKCEEKFPTCYLDAN